MTDIAEISKNTIRARAAAFVTRWEGTTGEQAEKQTFWNEFFAVFGIDRKAVGKFEALAERASTGNTGWIDFLYPNEMAVEHKSAGRNLDQAMDQLLDYLPSIHTSITPWLLVVSDFGLFKWRNLNDQSQGAFTLAELPDNLHLFWWMAGHETPDEAFATEEDVNLSATERMAVLHDALKASGYPEGARREWMTRILFCLFADDTEVWDRAAFHTFIAHQTRVDGSDLGSRLAELFQVLNQAPEHRPMLLNEDLAAFTYINGDLFGTSLPIAACDESIRTALLIACGFNWAKISPAIFGSMFQNVMTATERRQLGAHYTTEQNILRTIRPLFLDALEVELAAATTVAKLEAFHTKLAELRFFDPACGCGNFLVITYREIRRLETVTLRRLAAKQAGQTVGARRGRTTRRAGQLVASLEFLCKVRVDQFYGIEIEEFPARIARTALYLIDHIANQGVSAEFGEHFVRFPIPASPHIAIGNALKMDWESVVPADSVSFVFGNPPFVGKKARTLEQKDDMAVAFSESRGSASLDYVAAWYEMTARYIGDRDVRCAYVSTNSITQGEQVPLMWPPLLNRGLQIGFAHRTFAWKSEARGAAHVHCVIVGFSFGTWSGARTIFDYPKITDEPVARAVSSINPYLTEGDPITVNERRSPLVAVPTATFGSMPNDGSRASAAADDDAEEDDAPRRGNLLVSDDEAQWLRAHDPVAARYLRPLVSAKEMLAGRKRWCLWLVDLTPSDRRASPELTARLGRVKSYRERSSRPATKRLAASPQLFGEIRQPTNRYLSAPRHASSARPIIPMEFHEAEDIASDSTIAIAGADLYLFGVLQSQMFAAWMRAVGGYIKSDYRLSVENVYNTFPFPDASKASKAAVAARAQAVIDARLATGGALGDGYDTLAPNPGIAGAHRALDRAVDRLFGRQSMTTDADRLKVLFARYGDLVSPLVSVVKTRRRS